LLGPRVNEVDVIARAATHPRRLAGDYRMLGANPIVRGAIGWPDRDDRIVDNSIVSSPPFGCAKQSSPWCASACCSQA
jgi:hypothetical protein